VASANQQHFNRLSRETSPYLLQHQHNPVDWYPWGDEAFERARRENKPIFLSVGYSTCYWCHVMERQSFEDPAIADVMNRLFVNIKVDREERPDVDQLYMTAVQLISRQGGWPMSVWLTPDLKPFYGGTYYPPTDNYGRPGFPRVCQAVDDAWRNRNAEVQESAENIVALIRRVGVATTADEPIQFDQRRIGALIDRSTADYEPKYGGFGSAPKFPRQTALELLLTYLAAPWDDQATAGKRSRADVRRMTLHTLDAMMHGGVRDQLGGGFHRYSTDAKWLVPHFEIMLYDNAMLLGCYAEAYRQTGDARYAQVARDLADFVLRDLTSREGAFYTALDAEVDHQEGLNYLWTEVEVRQVLPGEEGDRFCRAYGLDQGPNFADPHHGAGVPDKNILYVAHPTPGDDSPLLDPQLRASRQRLLAARMKRKQPLLDTKILTSWNALMIRGLAIAGRVLSENRYIEAASRAARFLLQHHRMADGRLCRASRDGQAKYVGSLDDYAFLAWACTELTQATGDTSWSVVGGRLLDLSFDRFGPSAGDAANGGLYFSDRQSTDMIVRQQAVQDSPLPSGNAAAALALLALNRVDEAKRILCAFADGIVEHGEGMSSLVQAALAAVRHEGGFTVYPSAAAGPATDDTLPVASPAEQARAVVVATLAERGNDLVVALRVAPGWHINAHGVGVAGLIPTTVHVDAALEVSYPPGETLQAAYATEQVLVYRGEIELIIGGGVAGAASSVRVRYQPCDDSRCLPPVTVELHRQTSR
jgi:uncharacterized protein YyaL (SSP411 family)